MRSLLCLSLDVSRPGSTDPTFRTQPRTCTARAAFLQLRTPQFIRRTGFFCEVTHAGSSWRPVVANASVIAVRRQIVVDLFPTADPWHCPMACSELFRGLVEGSKGSAGFFIFWRGGASFKLRCSSLYISAIPCTFICRLSCPGKPLASHVRSQGCAKAVRRVCG